MWVYEVYRSLHSVCIYVLLSTSFQTGVVLILSMSGCPRVCVCLCTFMWVVYVLIRVTGPPLRGHLTHCVEAKLHGESGKETRAVTLTTLLHTDTNTHFWKETHWTWPLTPDWEWLITVLDSQIQQLTTSLLYWLDENMKSLICVAKIGPQIRPLDLHSFSWISQNLLKSQKCLRKIHILKISYKKNSGFWFYLGAQDQRAPNQPFKMLRVDLNR